MKGVLYISHGSRVDETKKEVEALIADVRGLVDAPLQELCYLELAEPDIAAGFEKLVAQGADDIAVVPMLLFSAGHYFQDIPEELEPLSEKHPHVRIRYGRPLGVQERLTNVAAGRIHETGKEVNSDAQIVLIGRGSKAPETKAATKLIGRQLKKKTGIRRVEVCYLAACEPKFEEGLYKALQKTERPIFLVPYLWFTGLLIQSLEKKAEELRSQGEEVYLCGYLGTHPSVAAALAERAEEALFSTREPDIQVEESKAWWI
ncbi:sirohydrochlorin chelatase [Alkalicoccus urumqiensis]|uniref:Sirohydrochlorin chelatase n=1 Tax=Alkalicoccus urumqiensis TaxID=1548213 RepID=A0A2P6MIG2_ALKUR|nr:sirohydrochlorin chelatase [Alkalicoccus urumqiensis]PRO66023.1 sirohydrochlorin chelatase [Alkalicoccus urumqiensis]